MRFIRASAASTYLVTVTAGPLTDCQCESGLRSERGKGISGPWRSAFSRARWNTLVAHTAPEDYRSRPKRYPRNSELRGGSFPSTPAAPAPPSGNCHSRYRYNIAAEASFIKPECGLTIAVEGKMRTQFHARRRGRSFSGFSRSMARNSWALKTPQSFRPLT